MDAEHSAPNRAPPPQARRTVRPVAVSHWHSLPHRPDGPQFRRMNFSRLHAALLLAVAARTATAQQAGPLALLLPTAARPAAMGNAWVAGRDEYAVFMNPAQLNATNGFGVTLSTFGGSGRRFAAA